MTGGKTASLLRVHSGAERVTNIELFFDLVYVFAITQLSHHLLGNPTWEGAWQTLLLLAAVVVWVAVADRLLQSDVSTNTPHPEPTKGVARG
jgi:low temperature requirement protein LtrA